jgi:hypothetical protein
MMRARITIGCAIVAVVAASVFAEQVEPGNGVKAA